MAFPTVPDPHKKLLIDSAISRVHSKHTRYANGRSAPTRSALHDPPDKHRVAKGSTFGNYFQHNQGDYHHTITLGRQSGSSVTPIDMGNMHRVATHGWGMTNPMPPIPEFVGTGKDGLDAHNFTFNYLPTQIPRPQIY